MKITRHRRNYAIFPDGGSNDSDDYEKRFPTCLLPNGDRIICRYSCMAGWKSSGVREAGMPFAYEVVSAPSEKDKPESSFELEMLLLEERMLTWVAGELGLIDCDISSQGGTNRKMREESRYRKRAGLLGKPDALVSSLASYDQDVKDPEYDDCINDTVSGPKEQCLPIVGFMTVGCNGSPKFKCEEKIADLLKRGMDEDEFINDSIKRVTWVGWRVEARETPSAPNNIVSLEAPEEKKSYVGMSLIIAAAVLSTLALIALLVRMRRRKDAEEESAASGTSAADDTNKTPSPGEGGDIMEM